DRINWLFFFFQAEDGIRDFHVTGVQTCALPIYRSAPWATCRKTARIACALRQGRIPPPLPSPTTRQTSSACLALAADCRFSAPRSEERRVGKEGRSRWWPYPSRDSRTQICREPV